jgi:hypothetical protein
MLLTVLGKLGINKSVFGGKFPSMYDFELEVRVQHCSLVQDPCAVTKDEHGWWIHTHSFHLIIQIAHYTK